jgi:3-hydroxyacyl-[acyl-carrier-protein] dehydratase
MLIKDFYTIRSINQIDTCAIRVSINLNKNHDVFKGHFPDNPVTPGVCMIQIIKEIAQTHVDSLLFLLNVSNVKFTAIINPYVNQNLILELYFIQENKTVRIKNITKFTDGSIALKCNITFEKR